MSISVYILSGFLGSGKTTVLKRIVEESKNRGNKLGIILNELGDTNVENHLFENEQMVELLNGCICCSIQDDLKATLQQFVENPVDVLVIEGTGVANPTEIVEALATPAYIDTFSIQSIISLVDASHYLEYQSIFSSSKEIRTLLKDQITSASLILLNKADLVSDRKLDKITAQIRKQVPQGISILPTSYGQIDGDELLMQRLRTVDLLNEEKQSTCGCSTDDTCTHNHVNHGTINAVKLVDLPKFERKTFEKWLRSLPEDVFRGKGIVQFKEDSNTYSFQFASRKLFLEEVTAGSKMQNPIIILIGHAIDQEAVKKSYETTFLQKV
ncbi:CobW family GTP-binding protein [Bacillus weihaiensis]|uniref:CobW family GTP-binding protein n=1 Tax=Bacillus weihaiensis TaxID=1547283 RepID=UPI002357C9E6|nr:GTP-binding protein [Bacillus weihaiensis]